MGHRRLGNSGHWQLEELQIVPSLHSLKMCPIQKRIRCCQHLGDAPGRCIEVLRPGQ